MCHLPPFAHVTSRLCKGRVLKKLSTSTALLLWFVVIRVGCQSLFLAIANCVKTWERWMSIKSCAKLCFWFVMGLSSQLLADASQVLELLNQARRANGLPIFQTNSQLTQAADNHARYMVARGEMSSHAEEEGLPEFTGVSCLERVAAAGYPAACCSENLSSGEKNWYESVTGLMTAIYHRKGFLDFNMDELGYAVRSGYGEGDSRPKNYFSYLMGNSVRRQLCQKPSSSYGYYACSDANKLVETAQFQAGKDALASRASLYAIYPWAGQQNVWPHFENVERPDPLPGIALTGQPISIHFNPVKLRDKTVRIEQFRLLDAQGHDVPLLPVKDQDSDSLFSAYDFAWFPVRVMDWNSTYQVQLHYRIDNELFRKEWSFTTAEVPFCSESRGARAGVIVVTPELATLRLPGKKIYSLVLSPELATSAICRYSVEYSGKLWIEKASFNVINMSVPKRATLILTLCDGQQHQVVIEGSK